MYGEESNKVRDMADRFNPDDVIVGIPHNKGKSFFTYQSQVVTSRVEN